MTSADQWRAFFEANESAGRAFQALADTPGAHAAVTAALRLKAACAVPLIGAAAAEHYLAAWQAYVDAAAQRASLTATFAQRGAMDAMDVRLFEECGAAADAALAAYLAASEALRRALAEVQLAENRGDLPPPK